MSDDTEVKPVYQMPQTNKVDVSSAFTDADATKPEDVIKVTQNVRMGILKMLTDHGASLPTDEDSIKLALSLMGSMDATAQNSAKLKIEEGNSKSVAEIAGLAAVFKQNYKDITDGASRIGSAMDNVLLPEITLIEGELDQGEVSVSPDDYL